MTTSAAPIAITGAAALTAAGGIAQTCGAIRAGLVCSREHAHLETVGRDPEWDEETPLIATTAHGIDATLDGRERLFAMLVPVLDELVRKAELRRADLRRTAFLVALPTFDPAVERWPLMTAFTGELFLRTSLEFKPMQTTQVGHTGMFHMLAEAAYLLANGEASLCIVAGVDTYLAPDRLEWLDRNYRVKSPRNVDGFVPGEAAVALLVERAAPGKPKTLMADGRSPRPHLAHVPIIATGQEPQTSLGDKPSSGAGLTAAIRAVLGAQAPAFVLCDLNGESYRAFEWGVVRSRLGEQLSGMVRVVHPASCFGDTGAASGGLLIAAAMAGFSRGWAPAAEALLWTSSDGPARAAARITAPQER